MKKVNSAQSNKHNDDFVCNLSTLKSTCWKQKNGESKYKMKIKSSSRLNGGGVKMRGRIMTKIELGPDHNQNTPSGGFEQVTMDRIVLRSTKFVITNEF